MSRSLKDDPLAAEWTWGLVAVAGLTLVKRYESFLIAVLRAHQEFVLTTELDLLEVARLGGRVRRRGCGSAASGACWPRSGSSGSRSSTSTPAHPLRFRWAWEGPEAGG